MTFSATDGIDVSHYNGTIDWSAVATAGVGFAFAKATEGASVQDSQFSVNYKAMAEQRMLRGAYHFFRPSIDVGAQVANFLSLVSSIEPGDLPPALDIEVTDGQEAMQTAAGAQAWLEQIEAALGRRPMIYTSASFWAASLGGSDGFTEYPLWVADYNTELAPNVPAAFDGWVVWQYSEHGQVGGVVGSVDLDHFNGSAEQLRDFAGL